MNLITHSASLLAALAALGVEPAAQTILAHDGANATVREISGPPDPSFCFYPIGPIKSQFLTPGAFACALPGGVPAGTVGQGDVAVDRSRDQVWVTDGDRVAAYDRFGLPVQSFGVPAPLLVGPVLGMGFDGAQDSLWLTDGQRAVEVAAPTVTCGTPTVLTPRFSLPQLGPVQGAVTDIAVDPVSGTLWVCDANGFIGNLTKSGVLLSSQQVTPGSCGLVPPLLGLAVDSAASVPGHLFVSDGATVATIDTTGAGTPTFGQPLACFALPGGKASGLGFSSRPIFFGTGGGSASPPEIGATGQAIIGGGTMTVTLSGAPPGSIAVLPFSLTPLCPDVAVAGIPLYLFPQAFAQFAQPVNGAGNAQQAIPIPPTASAGLEVFCQWFIASPAPLPDGPPLLSSGAGSMRTGFH